VTTVIDLIKAYISPDSVWRWILSGFYHFPIRFVFALVSSVICTKKLSGNYWPIRVRVAGGQKFRLYCSPFQKVQLQGILRVNQWIGSDSPSSLTLGAGSSFVLLGDFEVGPGVHIYVSPGAELKIAGRLNSSGSGITCNTRIMVEKLVEIGTDCIIAWDVCISDSDLHDIKGARRTAPVFIGNHVWIAHGSSIMKGAIIPSGCIVAAKSLVRSAIDSERALVAGAPAVVKRTGVEWSR
jgi:acetyltransferase-like isoleucine patch superfamily enzyme